MTGAPIVVVESYPHTYGGSQAVARLLCAALRARDVDASLLTTGPGPLVDRARADGTRVRQLAPSPALQRFGRSTTGRHAARAMLALPRFWWQVRRELRHVRPSVHVHDHRGMLLVGPAARWAGCRVVWHVHSVDGRRWLNAVCGRLAHRAITPSGSVLGRLAGLPSGLTIDVIPNPIDPRVLELPQATGGDPPLIVSAARLHPDKGLDVLLDAVVIARRTVPALHVEVYGAPQPGWEQHEHELLERRHALELDDVVTFMGFVDEPQAQWRRATAYVQPSRDRTEVRPLAILEAMVLGLPVVATDAGGLAELVDHERTGLVVPPEDPAALAEALVDVLTDPVRAARLRDGAASIRGEVGVAAFATAVQRTHERAAR
ncbi:MAG: glycosyltransferase family 4 protein [Acidimicrobiales bacterium]